jgi:hypothetical protein
VVTEAELEELLTDCPVLFHMAECGSWPSIRKHGLLCTTALLSLTGMEGEERFLIESARRKESVVIEHGQHGRLVIRDNKPMDDRGLMRCLQDGLNPRDWYELLNARVFFWMSRQRLDGLLCAGAYADEQHDVLQLDTRRVVQDYRTQITLSPINSGCTKPMPHPRGLNTFQNIDNYPYAHWRPRRRRGERVVELAVGPGVSDIERYVLRVTRMQAGQELEVLFEP